MMKTVATAEVAPVESFTPSAAEAPAAVAAAPSKFADYLELTKPRIAVMALFTVAIGYLLAAGGDVRAAVLLHTLFGALNWTTNWFRPARPLSLREVAEAQVEILLGGVRGPAAP